MALSLQRRDQQNAELIREQFVAAWARSDEIFAVVSEQDILARPIVWRHPFIFYIGHLPAFAWNQVCGALLDWQSCNPYFDDLFCRGIDPDVDTGECHWHPEVPDEWPSLAATLDYRDQARGAILQSVEALGERGATEVMAQGGRVFQMLLEHEYMHQETLVYMLQQMPYDKKQPPKKMAPYSFHPASRSRPVPIPAGKARLGARFDDIPFGWDNEFGELVVDVPSFCIETLPVTNGEFFEFVVSGAYDSECYWRAEDYRWKTLEEKHYPTCWSKRGDGWFYLAMFDELPLSRVASWPVYVSLAEARAYARWRGKRLPTEAEYHRAAFYGPDERETPYPWGDGWPEEQHGNFDFAAWSPVPVGSLPEGRSRWDVAELMGNGWELTDTPFAPLPGFTPYIRSYPDYSADFFDGKHYALKGASWATARELVRPSFRNWYQAHYPYVFAKFRCVSDL